VATKDTAMVGEGLIKADGLPDDLLRSLTYEQIQQVGYFLFSQLVKQRDASLKAGRREVVGFITKNFDRQLRIRDVLETSEWQAKLQEWRLVCSRCSAIRTDNIDSDICGSCADTLRQEQEVG